MIARHRLSEYLLKGTYLGLSAGLALSATQLSDVLLALTCALVAAALPLLYFAWKSPGPRVQGAWFARSLLYIIDHPLLVHLGIVTGTLVALLHLGKPILLVLVLGAGLLGTALGGAVHLLVKLRRGRVRTLAMAVGMGILLLSVMALSSSDMVIPQGPAYVVSLALFVATLLLYLLVFAGESEESELDIGLVAILLALALGSIDAPRTVRSIVVLLPVGLYVVYCERVLRHMIVFKHSVRGMEHERRKDFPQALASYSLALARDPKSELAQAGSARVHARIDLDEITRNPELAQLIDPKACLLRARDLLQRGHEGTGNQVQCLLDVVERLEPERHGEFLPLRLRASLVDHDRDYAKAVTERLLSLTPAELRQESLPNLLGYFSAWTLFLREPSLAATGSRMIRADGHLIDLLMLIEEILTQDPKQTLAAEFKTFLYRQLRWSDYERYRLLAGTIEPPLIDFTFIKQVAKEVALEPEGIASAVELARVAREGLPSDRLALAAAIAEWLAPTDRSASFDWLEQLCQEGIERGLGRLSSPERLAVDHAARQLARDAEEKGDISRAIDFWEIFASGPASGADTRRRLINLHRERHDLLSAIKHAEALRAFDLARAETQELQTLRDQLYREITPELLKPRLKEAERFFDFRFAYDKAVKLFEQKASEDEVAHFLSLAELAPPADLPLVNFLLGRLHRANGRDAEAAACFETVADLDASKIRDPVIKECHYKACRLLGELLVERLNQPDRAVAYLKAYADHLDSGADTLYLLAKAYELAGQPKHARKWYDMVLVYSSHPRAAAAREALTRLASP